MIKVFKSLILAVTILGLLVSATPVLAGDVTIQNNVNVSADTGGNSGENVNEGKASVDIRVEGEVDGKKQEPVIVHEETTGGRIEKEIEVESEDGMIKTKIKASADAEISGNSSEEEDVVEDTVKTLDSDVRVSNKVNVLAAIGNFFARMSSNVWLSIKSIF